MMPADAVSVGGLGVLCEKKLGKVRPYLLGAVVINRKAPTSVVE
jgi:hypothetical protein